MTVPPPPTDIELVDCAAQTYTRTDPFAENIDNAVRVFLTTLSSGLNVIAFEGTKNAPGWLLDFLAISSSDLSVIQLFLSLGAADHPTIQHPRLGLVHAGFDAGVKSVMSKVALIAAGPFAITGHSLGAALALRATAEFILDGTPPLKCAAFAPPRVGGDKFVKITTSIPISAYKWGDDPVPEVPFTLPPKYDYRQVPLTKVGHFELEATACHNIKNYVSAVHAMVPS